MRFIAQILVINAPEQNNITSGYIPLVYYHLASVACRLDHIIATVDKKTGKVLCDEPESIKNGDYALVEFVPEADCGIETFAEFPPLGRIIVQDKHKTIAVGVVK